MSLLSTTLGIIIVGALGCRDPPSPNVRAEPTAATSSMRPGDPPSSGALRDEAGRTVTPRAWPARRIISLAPNVTEVLFALGAEPLLVGLDAFSDYPAPQVDRLPRVGSDLTPSLEKIAALAPDIVIVSVTANRRETVDALEALAIPTFVTDTRTLADMDRLWRNLGLVTGRRDQAEAHLRHLHAGLDAIRGRAGGAERPGVLVVVWDDPLFVAGRGTFVDDLIDVAGGRNVAHAVTGFVRYSLEQVLRAQPEVIVIPTHAVSFKGAEAVAYWSRWPTLPAVRNHRVHAVEDAVISRPGARLAEGAETLLALIHPR